MRPAHPPILPDRPDIPTTDIIPSAIEETIPTPCPEEQTLTPFKTASILPDINPPIETPSSQLSSTQLPGPEHYQNKSSTFNLDPYPDCLLLTRSQQSFLVPAVPPNCSATPQYPVRCHPDKSGLLNIHPGYGHHPATKTKLHLSCPLSQTRFDN